MHAISFGTTDLFKNIPDLNPNYTTKKSKDNTIGILGSSKETDAILNAMDLCSETTRTLVNMHYNIVTGCGTNGIMGKAFQAAKENSLIEEETGKPKQNLTIIMNPPYGDEDITNSVPIAKANSELDRIDKFSKTANSFIIFPGSATTISEAAALIQQNEYTKEKPKKIILVGNDFFAGLNKQYQALANAKLLKHKPEELFKVVDTEKEILKEVEAL